MIKIKLLELTTEIKLNKTKEKGEKRFLVKMGLNPVWALDPKLYEHH